MRTHGQIHVLPLLFVAACAGSSEQASYPADEIIALFNKVEVGDPRARVEELLGKPMMEYPGKVDPGPLHAPEEVHATYLEAPPMNDLMSPYMFGAIEITYVGERVAAKELNPHVTQASTAARR